MAEPEVQTHLPESAYRELKPGETLTLGEIAKKLSGQTSLLPEVQVTGSSVKEKNGAAVHV